MFFKKDSPKKQPASTVSAPKPQNAINPDDFFRDMGKKSAPQAAVNPDDFFKDMGKKKPAAEPVEVKETVDIPEITGLREAPEAVLPSNMNDLDTSDLVSATAALRDKAAEDDGAYHGNMNDADESSLDMSILERKKAETPPPVQKEEGSQPLTADDFFSNMGKKTKPVEIKEEIESPEIVGLRETPEVILPSNMNDLNTDTLTTNGLRDKTAEDDGTYHGSMSDV